MQTHLSHDFRYVTAVHQNIVKSIYLQLFINKKNKVQ